MQSDSRETLSDLTVVKELFGLVLDAAEASTSSQADSADRAIIDEANAAMAAAEPVVRDAVDRLLAAHQRAAGVLLEEKPARTGASDAAAVPSPPRIAGYEIGEEIGHGGFGVVYQAMQLHPVQRPVAVKILRTELASANVIARFRGEARVLAKMNHPGIARVLDAGLDSYNRPFLAMELVEGEALVKYCDLHVLSVRERVRLMVDVCDAVHHAHQRAVIHRDLKPANILVERIDGRHRPRIIDFGIAKILQEEPVETRTQEGARLGTPRYMSPEQAAGTDEADVRSDVYALGVILCEALTHQVPRGPVTTGDRSGSRPKTRASRPSQLAAVGDPEVALRSRELRGDLDRIVLKAVALEPDGRYESAAALADDLERYLDGRPVLASPPSALYLTRKFIARHKMTSAAIMLAVLSLIGGAGAAMYGRARAHESRLAAESAFVEAESQRIRAEAVTDFLLGNLLDALNPDLTGNQDRSLSTLFRSVANEAERRLGHDQQLLIDVMGRLGTSMRTVTDFEGAADALHRAAELSSEISGASHHRTLELRIDALLARMSARRLEGIVETITEIYADALHAFGEMHPITLRAKLHFAHIANEDDAIDTMRAVVTAFEDSGLAGSEYHLEALMFLGRMLRWIGDPEAGVMFQRAAAIASDRVGHTHSLAIELRLQAAGAMVAAGEYEEAEAMSREVVETSELLYGQYNWYQYDAYNTLIQIAFAEKRYDEAMALSRRRLEAAIFRLGENSNAHAVALHSLGLAALESGEYAEAVENLTRAVELRTSLHGEANLAALIDRAKLARALIGLDRHAEVAAVVAPVLAELPAGHTVWIEATLALAEATQRLDGRDAADDLIERFLEMLPERHPQRPLLDAWLAADSD
jgi:eukaryotic-like serine/threonine-protein kinase